MPFVVIEKNHDHLETARDLGYLVLSGDAGEDAILEKAGILKAVGLIATLGSMRKMYFSSSVPGR